MTTEYINAARAEVDSTGRVSTGVLATEAKQDAAIVHLATLAGNSESGASTPIAVKVTTNAWDANGEIDIPAGTLFLHVYASEDSYLVASASTDDPAQNGCFYPKQQVHLIPCKGKTKLHCKNVSALAGSVYATAFAGA